MEKFELLGLIAECLSKTGDYRNKLNQCINSLSSQINEYERSIVVLSNPTNTDYIKGNNTLNLLYTKKAELSLELNVLKLIKKEELD